jgi:glycosyltransferase involved in cell wall biosynthesis
VVASDVPPVREVIRDGENGHLVPFFDTAALARKTTEVLEAPDRSSAIRRNAAVSVRETYDFETCILPKFIDLIRELVPDAAAQLSSFTPSPITRRNTRVLTANHA